MMNSDQYRQQQQQQQQQHQQQHQLQNLTDFWKEPWTASTWGTWSNQNLASQGLSTSSWMYTSQVPKLVENDGMDFDFDSFSSDETGFSASSSVTSPGSSPTRHQPWLNSNGQAVHHHHHHHHHHHSGAVKTSSPPTIPMTQPPLQQQPPPPPPPPPPGLSPQRYDQPGGGSIHHTPHSLLAAPRPPPASGREGASRSSSIESECSALELHGGGAGGPPCAFQIPGYRTVELLPTALQRQTLQKWFGVVRWTHNRAVDALRIDPAASAPALRGAVAKAEAEHDWAAAVPLAIRDATVAQLVGALHLAQRSAEVAAVATGENVIAEPIGTAAQNKALKYRTRKDRLEQVVLRAEGFQYGIPYPDFFGYAPLASSAPIPARLHTDAILVRSTERFYLCIPDSC